MDQASRELNLIWKIISQKVAKTEKFELHEQIENLMEISQHEVQQIVREKLDAERRISDLTESLAKSKIQLGDAYQKTKTHFLIKLFFSKCNTTVFLQVFFVKVSDEQIEETRENAGRQRKLVRFEDDAFLRSFDHFEIAKENSVSAPSSPKMTNSRLPNVLHLNSTSSQTRLWAALSISHAFPHFLCRTLDHNRTVRSLKRRLRATQRYSTEVNHEKLEAEHRIADLTEELTHVQLSFGWEFMLLEVSIETSDSTMILASRSCNSAGITLNSVFDQKSCKSELLKRTWESSTATRGTQRSTAPSTNRGKN